MEVTFLVCAENAVYQICTPTVESHGPDKGGSSSRLGPQLPLERQFIAGGQSEAFRVPMPGSQAAVASHSPKN